MSEALRGVFRAYDAGHAAIMLEERSLYDLAVDRGGQLRPAVEVLRRIARDEYGMHLITYSMAQGLDWDAPRCDDRVTRDRIEQTLRLHHLWDLPQDQNEVVRVLRGIASMARAPRGEVKWPDGRDLRFAFLLEFAEHLAPGSLTNGTQSDLQLVVIELTHVVSQSLALRKSGNLILFHGRPALIDPLVAGAMHRVRVPHANRAEKKQFIEAALALYTGARFDPGMTTDIVAHLTTNTPNRGLEQLLRASHFGLRPVSASEVVEQKRRDVVALSEQSLSVIETERIRDVRLVGRNSAVPSTILDRLAARLRAGDKGMPANVLLAGAPGTGKTDLAILTADTAGVTAYRVHSPKRGIVGETERLCDLQQDLLRHWTPNVAFVDEITESLPLQRSDFDGDSGATRAVMATMLTALSDESRRGSSLLIATTNCPWRMSAAMRSRFVFVPVLQPLVSDIPAILAETAARVQPGISLDCSDARIVEAAEVFYRKGASPRHVREALTSALMFTDTLTEDAVLCAARDLTSMTDRASAVYADLWAIRCCGSRRFLPWADCSQSYPYPDYLADLVDQTTGDVDIDALERRIEEYRPHANV
jgi:AAA+ superfamily predicted ATPase